MSRTLATPFLLSLALLLGPAARAAAPAAVAVPPAAVAAPAPAPPPAATPVAAAPRRPAAQPSPPPADCPAEVDRLAAAARAAPDDLRRGSNYRREVIACGAYDRAIAFFGELTAAHPKSAPALLNYGYAYVDKIPAAGAITRVILANTALTLFTQAVDLEPSWLALYTRGNSYLYWPKVFGRAPLGVADLERAVALGKTERQHPYQLRAWIALGDGYWKTDQLDKARTTWQEALRLFPGEPRLAARLAKQGDELAALIEADLDPDKRVDTDLSVLGDEP